MKVIDKRMFTPEGELREGFEPSEEAPAGEERSPEATPVSAPPNPPPPSGVESPPLELPGTPEAMGGPAFADLVAVLAEPVALYLGDVELPDGRSAENLDAARFHIDLLDVLRRTTQGNLDAEEARWLDDILYRMRVRYVQKRG